MKPVGNTSVVLKVRLDGDLAAAWKPRTTTHPQGWRAEIAAYRIARLLGFDNVAPVVSRRFRADQIVALLEGDPARWQERAAAVRWDADGSVPGAAIYWIPRMEDLGLESPSAMARWAPWLRQGSPLPAERAGLARDLSNVVVFDYLIANWDRWSGENLQALPGGSRLFVRDHNAAFLEPLPAHLRARLAADLERVERFSRGVVEALRTLDEASLREELAQDPENARTPLLDDARIAALLARRAEILRHVDALVAAHGPGKVLAFD